jgi:hypothetical protein
MRWLCGRCTCRGHNGEVLSLQRLWLDCRAAIWISTLTFGTRLLITHHLHEAQSSGAASGNERHRHVEQARSSETSNIANRHTC